MIIGVKLMGILKDKAPANGQLELPDGGSIEDALRALGIATDSVNVFTVNGEVERDRCRALSAADELTILPPVGGG
jgi:sulfur carrier protein ThiS